VFVFISGIQFLSFFFPFLVLFSFVSFRYSLLLIFSLYLYSFSFCPAILYFFSSKFFASIIETLSYKKLHTNSLIIVPSLGFHYRALYRWVKLTKLSTRSVFLLF
jgi:hypothetical protein